MSLFRHSRESGNPEGRANSRRPPPFTPFAWIPAFAGMTRKKADGARAPQRASAVRRRAVWAVWTMNSRIRITPTPPVIASNRVKPA